MSWDLRSLWSALPWSARAYLFLLLCSTVAIILVAITVWRRARRQEMNAAGVAELASRKRLTFHLRQFLFLQFLVFGVIVTDMVFASFRAFEYSMHVDVDGPSPFDGPITFAFVVLSYLLFLFSLLWTYDLRLDRFLQKSRVIGPSG